MTASYPDAFLFAKAAHAAVGQVRKYDNTPYIQHPYEAATILSRYRFPEFVLCAALLHDVVEDTKITVDLLAETFGVEVANLVNQVTDVSKPEDGNREHRKRLDREHLAKADYNAQNIKLADLISNARNIVEHDKDFAVTFLKEMRLLLDVLTNSHEELYREAVEIYEQSVKTVEHWRLSKCLEGMENGR